MWHYPRPPRAERVTRRAVLRYADVVVADTTDLVRVLETSHPPTFYLPRAAFGDHLRPAERTTFCEWKGAARYVDVVVPGAPPLPEVGWWYPEPDRRYPELFDRVAVYAGPFDEVSLDGEVVSPQPGGFYGGWVTADVIGPFKGDPGSWGWWHRRPDRWHSTFGVPALTAWPRGTRRPRSQPRQRRRRHGAGHQVTARAAAGAGRDRPTRAGRHPASDPAVPSVAVDTASTTQSDAPACDPASSTAPPTRAIAPAARPVTAPTRWASANAGSERRVAAVRMPIHRLRRSRDRAPSTPTASSVSPASTQHRPGDQAEHEGHRPSLDVPTARRPDLPTPSRAVRARPAANPIAVAWPDGVTLDPWPDRLLVVAATG